MPILVLRLPGSSSTGAKRPLRCPYCSGQVIQRWGSVEHRYQGLDNYRENTYRYRCCTCDRTFQWSPVFDDPFTQTGLIHQLAAILYGLGMSFREVENFLGKKGIHLSRMTIWRDWQAMLLKVKELDPALRIDRFFIDRVYLQNVSSKLGVVILVDFGQGRQEVLGTLSEYNPHVVEAWLSLMAHGTCIKVSILGTAALDPLFVQQSFS